MPLPQRFKVIDDDQLPRLHQATLEVLEKTGVRFRHQEALDIFRDHGATVDGEVVRLSAGMVEKAIQTIPATFEWLARDPERNRTMGDGHLVQPMAGAVSVFDLDTGRRPGSLEDHANFQKIYQAGDQYDLVGMIPCEPAGVDQDIKHLELTYRTLKHTTKPVNGFMTRGEQAEGQLDLMAIALGGEEKLTGGHYMCFSIAATSPLSYAWDPVEAMLSLVRRNQVPTVLSAPSAGVTSPFSMLGTAVQQSAELLAGLVLIQLVAPGHPAVYCPSATTGDMRTGGYATGTPEGMLINVVNIQLARDLYNIPVRAMTGMTEAKLPDFQAGAETMQNLMMGMLAGGHLLNEVVGAMDNLLMVGYEKTILDGELIARVRRIHEGLKGPDLDLDLEEMDRVGPEGTYLMQPSTLANCRARWQPSISFWGSWEDWRRNDGLEAATRANREVKRILETSPEMLIDQAADEEMRAYLEARRS